MYRRLYAFGLALFALSCTAEIGGSRSVTPGEGPVVATLAPLFTDTARVLSVTAHQDDDIFLMTPDLWNDIRANRVVRTVVLTDGDANMPCNQYVVERGKGQMPAWEAMAGVNYGGNWPITPTQVAGHTVLIAKMPDASRDLSIVYVGLANTDTLDLERLWNDQVANPTLTIQTKDTRFSPPQVYSREGLIQLVRQLIIDFAPTHLNTMDSGKTWPLTSYPDEHTDHAHGALFALAALQRITTQPTTLRMYRAYNAIFEVDNVAAVDAANKHAIYNAYAPHDGFLCQGATFTSICNTLEICEDPGNIIYGPFEHIQYPISVFKGINGVLRGPNNQCLKVNGSVAAGSTLSVGACTGSLPKWSFPNDGTMRTGALCVSANTGSDPTIAATRGSTLRLEACNTASRQRFAITGLGQLRGPDATCVSAATAGTLKLAECANDSNLLNYAINFAAAPFAATNGTDFASIPSGAQGGALTYGDLDGDLDSDVCVRRSNGVYCATNNGANSFTGHSLRLQAFRDADGYGTAATGGTLQLADVDGDGKADLCARNANDGIYCAKNTGSGAAFNAPSKRSNGLDFSDWVGYGLDDTYFGSIRFADVNHDNKIDVCGRNSDGIECATNGGTGMFAGVFQRENVEFSDALLWFDSPSGTTMQYGDIDGDGYQDVCGRGGDGIICMLGTGSVTVNAGFERAHIWSNTGDFSDDQGWNANAAYYGSIRLGDINGDGRADVCGRKANGVMCGLSTGQAFAPARLMIPNDPFTDANYGSVANGASLALLRLDGDTHRDVCLRGTLSPAAGTGLRCALAP
jgi:hypothetical protein